MIGIDQLKVLVFIFTIIRLPSVSLKCHNTLSKTFGSVGQDKDCNKDVVGNQVGGERIHQGAEQEKVELEEKIVPKICPNFTWGTNCELSCSNCTDSCDMEFGVCNHCKPGHKYPFLSCSLSCGTYEYGVDCEGSCLRKCGTDCTERIHGTCPISIAFIIALAIVGLVTVCALRIMYDLVHVNMVRLRKVKAEVKDQEKDKSYVQLFHPLINRATYTSVLQTHDIRKARKSINLSIPDSSVKQAAGDSLA